ncbi:MAG: PQQ-dependent sugar dehydrogenase, partial [Nitrospinae bacterium]|nr:PQQ-dependent sugar dehydrogenase [Nitrospinota bacterium]
MVRTPIPAFCLSALLFSLSSVLFPPDRLFAFPGLKGADLQVERVAGGLDNPAAIAHAGDGSNLLFIVLQKGKIAVLDGDRVLPEPFLDISSLVSCCGERGLLGVAFHPRYAENGRFYVNYTDRSGDTTIARYTRSAGNPKTANPKSAAVLLTVGQPYSNHNGGQLQFGPDGYLYIGMGDGGAAGDPQNRAQNLSSLLGKMLRIDVDKGTPYAIPPSNPFVQVAGARGEIWAYGLRNPWRFSFDRRTGDLFVADVGQDRFEEIDYQPADSRGGENYGWRLMEGNACYNPLSNCDDGTLTPPIAVYNHDKDGDGHCAVIGGYRYRGKNIPPLDGVYIYGDYCSGRIWGTARDADGRWTVEELLDTPLSISAFGEDGRGELYVADHPFARDGAIYRI